MTTERALQPSLLFFQPRGIKDCWCYWSQAAELPTLQPNAQREVSRIKCTHSGQSCLLLGAAGPGLTTVEDKADGTGCMYHHRFWCFTDRTSSSHMSVVLTGVVLSTWLFTLIFRRLLSSQNVKMIRITLSVIVTPCRTCSFRQMFVELCLTHLQVQVSFTTNVVP